MHRRLYFLLPDVPHTMRAISELMSADIEMRLHIKAGADIDRLLLPDKLQDIHKDTEHLVERIMRDINLAIFFLGLPLIVLAVLMGWNSVAMMILALIFVSLVIGFINDTIPDVKLSDFDHALSCRDILLMVDTKRRNVKTIDDMMHRLHPEAVVAGVSWHLDRTHR